tara:strand:+ start:26763 stop:29078 length:2316 start_codon:yes stop_codon:yes gene_type:complete
MADAISVQEESGIKRTRKRPKLVNINNDEIVKRVKEFAANDISNRGNFMDDRLQRYAKYRGWTERQSGPWEDSSDITHTDMMTHSMKLQDVLFNALLSTEPPVTAMAHNKADVKKEKTIDDLIQHQLFVDMRGTELYGEVVENFVNDGVFTAFVPWIREKRDVIDLRIFPELPEETTPTEYFMELIRSEFPTSLIRKLDSGWDFIVNDNDETFTAQFYTNKDDKIEMVMEREVDVFDGPRPIVKDIDEVLHPWRAANLQPPSPSNPHGSGHVVLVDYPTVDEIKRLKKSGFYDLVKDKDIDAMENAGIVRTDQEMKDQKDELQGTNEGHEPQDKSHKTLTRYTCFDVYEGKDMIWWIILETSTMLKASHMTEMYPAHPPRRPFAEASFLPVKNRRLGVSYLEMMEGLHDVGKEILDQTIDAGTISNSPFFFYKNSANNPDMIRLGPGDGYPMADPKNDIHFPQIQSNQTFGINTFNIIEQMQSRLTLTNDLNFGGVPQGASSALRTEGNMQMVLGQSESRPERVMRRLFEGLAEMYNQIHELNQRFLPDEKKILKTGIIDPDADPYLSVKDTREIQGRMEFTFSANMLNTSKAGMQQALNQLSGTLVSELMMNAGIVTKEEIYNLAEDTVKALGQDPRRYIRKPSPDSGAFKIFAEEALTSILQNNAPIGNAAEAGGAAEHLQKIIAFTETDQFGNFKPQQVEALKQYIGKVQAEAQQQQQMQQQAAAAAQFGGNQQPTNARSAPNADAATALQPQQLSEGETFASQPGEN